MVPCLRVAACLSLPVQLVTLLTFSTLSFAQNISLSPAPRAANANVSAILDASFAGFGIEPSNLFSFTGRATANQLSVGLLQNLADYSGAPPHIRLGGNTQDYMVFDDAFEDYECKENPNTTSQGVYPADGYIIGPAYFKALDRFPKNTPITYGLNLAYYDSNYIDRIVKGAQAAVDGMKNVKLHSFEIGNEPDLYLKNGFRNGSWGGQIYTKEFLARADAVYNQVLKPAGFPATFFEAQATASTIATTFEIELLVKDGLLNQTNGNNYVSLWNQHDYFHFIGVSRDPLTLDDLMDLDNTDAQFLYWKQQAEIAFGTGLPYVIREMSSVGPIGMHQVSDTHGAALWTLNFFLYTATLNISSVQMHMTDNSNSSAWQPIDLYGQGPHVRAQYYAHAAVAQIIGNGNATTQIGMLNINTVDPSYTGRIRAFTAYSKGNLQSVILINSKQANVSSPTKENFTFSLNLGTENANKTVYLSYLTADGADSLNGTTWNGLTYSDTDGKASVVNDKVASLLTSTSGNVAVAVRDSQAVVVNIGWLLGSVDVLDSGGNVPEPTHTTSNPACTGTGTATLASGTGSCAAVETGAKKKGVAGRTDGSWGMIGAGLAAIFLGMI
ncbi:glycoside hydrolase family 79 protein [Melanomma pulvis-pyrius CBS 109.77]|uniref:Glycoside hydrolase family 79 protein n=1 Tax=Melanomma pulvis-pyrius CBS 109.77 TaxID=1314802 RepID=A0A6A6XTT5_9PLEO|nr:glycoside hydrolase family 79 protein [Melanomma pulvis-pyrius CBS 109.77]